MVDGFPAWRQQGSRPVDFSSRILPDFADTSMIEPLPMPHGTEKLKSKDATGEINVL